MAEFFYYNLDNNSSLAVEEDGKCFAFGSRSDDGFDDTTFLVYGSLIRFILISRDVIAKVEMPRRSTTGTSCGQVRAVRMYFDNHIRFTV